LIFPSLRSPNSINSIGKAPLSIQHLEYSILYRHLVFYTHHSMQKHTSLYA